MKKGLAGLHKAVWARVSSPSLHEKLEDGIPLLLLMSLLLVGNHLLEQTPPFRFLSNVGYEMLQLRLRLSSRQPSPELEVVVVDITDMPMEKNHDFTDRKKLRSLLDEIAAQRPRAIAIDLDFEPEAKRWKDDREFLQHCFDLRDRVPIYVGVYTAVALGPWVLGDPRFKSLAAFVGFPKGKPDELRRWAVQSVDMPNDNHSGDWSFPSLSAAATKPISDVTSFPTWLDWLFERENFFEPEERKRNEPNEPKDKGFRAKGVLVDYGLLETFEHNDIGLKQDKQEIDTDDPHAFYKKYVFVGRGKRSGQKTGDKFVIPGRTNSPHAGVYVHACTAQTFLGGALFVLSGWGRSFADAMLSLFVIGFVVSYSHWKRKSNRAQRHRLEKRSFLVAAALVVLVGYGAVRWTRFMWDDFFLVALALGAHPWMENKLRGAYNWAASHIHRENPLAESIHGKLTS